jgi:hypothetical protein
MSLNEFERLVADAQPEVTMDPSHEAKNPANTPSALEG